jgi:hypothetical protein
MPPPFLPPLQIPSLPPLGASRALATNARRPPARPPPPCPLSATRRLAGAGGGTWSSRSRSDMRRKKLESWASLP